MNTLLNIKSNSTIKLKSFDNAIYEVEYLLENQYTDYFSTTVETKAEIELGWKAKYALDEMCEDSWRWQSNNPNGYEK